MKFTVDGTAAGGAQAAGQGVGSIFKALALAPAARQQAEQEAALTLAKIYNANMTGNKAGAEAQAQTMTNDVRTNLNLDEPGITPYERSVRQAFKWTGDRNIERVAKAGTQFQTQNLRDRAIEAPDVDAMNRLISVAGNKAYMPFDDVGQTGVSINKATGAQVDANAVLQKLFSNQQGALANQRNASAGASNAMRDLRVNELNTLKDQAASLAAGGGNGAASSMGAKPLTNAQLRTNQDIDAARSYVNDLPRETVAGVMRKSSLDLSEQEKDILSRIKKARTAKYGESNVPSEYNDALGLDKAIVERIIGALNNPAEKRNFFSPNRPMTEEEVLAAQKATLPASEAPNFAQYVAAAKQRRAGATGNLTHDGLPARQNADGSQSTELSITVTDPRLNGGKPTNIPSLWGGQVVDNDTAVTNALATGKPYQSFGTIDQAVAAAKARSNAGGANANKNSPAPASSSTMEFKPTPDMLKVQADFKAGKLSRDEAKKKLKALGMPD